MTIALITDGMLYPIITLEGLHAPLDPQGHIDPLPVTPCDPEGILEDTPPATPRLMRAARPAIPVVPCGPTGSDPTIDPPKVPRGVEGSGTPDSGSPSTPRCPRGRKQ